MARLLNLDPTSIPDNVKIGDIPGWDSLGHVSFLLELKEHYGIPTTRASFEACSTLEGVLQLLEERGIKNFDV